jgi:hypothetical protein
MLCSSMLNNKAWHSTSCRGFMLAVALFACAEALRLEKLGPLGSTVVTELGRGPAVAELAAAGCAQ